jgi:ribosomal protein L37AE/L43A
MDRPRRDPTANTAIGNVMREQRRKRRRDATMKQDLNPCAKCGGTAVIRYEAGIAVAACTNCGRMVGGDADGTRLRDVITEVDACKRIASILKTNQ